jgi:hypothetical protein
VLAVFQVTAAAGSLLGAAGAGALAAVGGLRFPYLVIAVLQALVGVTAWSALAVEAPTVTSSAEAPATASTTAST